MSKFETYVFSNENYIDLKPIQFGSEKCDPLHSVGPTVKTIIYFIMLYLVKGNFFLLIQKHLKKKKIL